jgi:hypothetical protein
MVQKFLKVTKGLMALCLRYLVFIYRIRDS